MPSTPRLQAALLAAALLVSPVFGFDLQGHRGTRGLAPENTLPAFDRALALGVTTLELDVALTADGVLVESHDPFLNPVITRDADGQWLDGSRGPLIKSLTLAQLRSYDVGRFRPGTRYADSLPSQAAQDGTRVPTLAQVFELARARKADVRFNIETKVFPDRPDDTVAPEVLTRAVLAVVQQAGMQARVTLQSFDWRSLALVAEWAPQLPRAYLTTARTLKDSRWTAGLVAGNFASIPALVQAAAGSGPATVIWSPAFNDLGAAQVQEAHALKMLVLPWTVNQPADMARMLDLGVDGLITDFPDVLRASMRERGMTLPAGGAR